MLPKPGRTRGEWALLLLTAIAFLLLGLLGPSWIEAVSRQLQPVVARRPLGGATITTRPLGVVVAYSMVYLLLALTLVHQLLRDRTRTRWVAIAYGAVLAIAGGLIVAGRLTGLAPWLTPPGRALIGFLVSPLPVLLAIGFFRLVVDPMLRQES